MFDSQEFDYSAALDGLRCRPTDWLRERRGFLVREQRRLRVEELAVTKVLDERGQVDVAANGVSERAARETIELARALESRPAIAAAAYRGELSAEQLTPVVKVADAAMMRSGPGRMTMPARLDRAIRLRDRHCRWPGCERTRGLQIRHLIPVSHGGHTEPGNLACVCTNTTNASNPTGPIG